MLTFLQPLPVGGTSSPGVVMIMVREDTILRMMRSVSEAYKGDFFIFDAQGQPIVASNEALVQSSGDLTQLVSSLGKDSGSLSDTFGSASTGTAFGSSSVSSPGSNQGSSSGIHRIDGVSYLVSYTVSDKNGWKYVSLLPVSESLQGLRTIQLNTILLVGGILLLEVIVIYVSIRKNYHPIKRLVEFAAGLFEPEERGPMNEIEAIRYTLSGLSAVNSRLDEEVKETLPIMRDNMLLELVNGHFLSGEQMLREAAKVGVSLDGARLTVAVISCDSETEETNLVLLYCKNRENQLPEGVQGYFSKATTIMRSYSSAPMGRISPFKRF